MPLPDGLSSHEAQQRLLEELTTLISKNSTVNWTREIRRTPFSVICSTLIGIAGLFLVLHFAVAASDRSASILFQGLFLIFMAAFNMCLFGWEVYILRTQKIRHLLVRLGPLFDSPCPWSSSDYPKSSVSTLRGELTVPAYRDNALVNVPISLLVRGDVIELDSGVPCPANSQLLESGYGFVHFPVDEVLPDHLYRAPHPEGVDDAISFLPETKPVRLVVEDTPILALLKSSMQRVSASSFLTKETNFGFSMIHVVVLAVVYVTSLTMNLVRYFALPEDFEGSWPDLILGNPAYTCLPILFLQFPFVWSFTNLYGTARISQLVDNGPHYFQSRGIERVKVFFGTLLSMAKLVLSFSHYPDYRVFHVLGTLTSVCAVDKEYLLTSGFPSPERVLFLRTEEVADEGNHPPPSHHPELVESVLCDNDRVSVHLTSPEIKTTTSKNRKSQSIGSERVLDTTCDSPGHLISLPSPHVDTVSTMSTFSDSGPFELVTEIFNLSPDPMSYSGIAFDQIHWQEHIGSLKPIGVNLLATSHISKVPFHLSHSSDCNELQLYFHKSSCPCSLSVEIGVTEYFSKNFEREVLIHSFSDPNLDFQRAMRRRSTATTFMTHNNSIIHPHIISSVVKELECGKTLVMSRGSADLVASCCSDFWDGKDLQPMTAIERESIVDYYNCRSLSTYCIALAYSPLSDANLSNLPSNKVGIYVPPCHLEHTHADFSLTVAPMKRKAQTKSEAESVFKSLQCNQVFLGLVCLQFRPKQDIVALVEDLYTAGVRFVHFTAENELQGKIFAQKMGLEVDWNCYISLAQPLDDQEPSLDEDNGSDDGSDDGSSMSSSVRSFFNSTMSHIRAKLPVGIKNIRPHIEMVDNVPLLVSLFTNCNAETITEMIQIMQENSEVVLCLGNAWNHKNVGIFSQADISLSLVPQHVDLPKCTMTETCALSSSNSSQNASSIHLHDKLWPSPLELASYLNSASCQLCFGRDNDVSLLSLVTESRRILSSVRLGLLFGLGASVSLSFMMLLSSIFFLPPPLNGGHLLWLLIFIIPFITISFLSVPLDPKVRTLMPDKKKDLFSNKWLIAIELILLFGLSVVVLLTMFGLTLSEICARNIANSSCHPLLGDRREPSSAPWNGWAGEAEQGHLLAQDVTAFFTSLYLVVLSVRFIHQTQPIWRLWQFTSWQYVVVAVVAVLLQVLYSTLSQAINPLNLTVVSGLDSVPVSVWCLGFVWPLVIVMLLEVLKYVDKRKMFEAQTLLRLQFGTKLGMHSPV